MKNKLTMPLILFISGAFLNVANADENDAITYCESIDGTPIVFEFALGKTDGDIFRTGMQQTWCNLHLKVSKDDKSDNHALVEVNTLANQNITLVGYAVTHPDTSFQPPKGSNPAYEYCLHMGGVMPTKISKIYPYNGWLMKGDDADNFYGNCIFSDGSSINQWTLMYSTSPENKAFRDAIMDKFSYDEYAK